MRAVLVALILTVGSAEAAPAAPQPQATLVPTAQGGLIEVLDWGGTGVPVLLLAGLGDTAHVFEDFAPALTDSHRVCGLTRRGFGASKVTLEGYDTASMAADIGAACDALGLDGLVLVAHKQAGVEAAWFAQGHPDRVRGLVYLDAAMNRLDEWNQSLDVRRPAPEPIKEQDLASVEALRAYLGRTQGSPVPPGEVRATWRFDEDGRALGPVTPRDVYVWVRAGLAEVDHARWRGPALAIFTIPTLEGMFPRHAEYDAENAALAEQALAAFKPWTGRLIASFADEAPQARVVTLPMAGSHVFLAQREAVLAEIRAFLRALPEVPR